MSTTADMPLFGRRWELKIELPPDAKGDRTVLTVDNESQQEGLRLTFDVCTRFYATMWTAEIAIYNLDFSTTQTILGGGGVRQAGGDPIRQGMIVTLSAGYQHPGKFGIVFSGVIFQATFERQEAVDFVVRLHCILGLDSLTRKSIVTTFDKFATQTEIATKIAGLAFSDKEVRISPNIKQSKQSRGGVIFGSAAKHLHEIADGENMQWFVDSRGLSMARIDDNIPTDTTPIVFSPPVMPQANTSGPVTPSGANGVIVGVPVQTQYGCKFTALLDPTVVVKYPAMLVRIDNSQIQLLKRNIGDKVNPVLDRTGTYLVLAVRYFGDTRGTPWYSEIDGLVSVGGKWAAAQALGVSAVLNGYK